MFVYLVTYLADADPFDGEVNIFQEEVTLEERITQVDVLAKSIVVKKKSHIKQSAYAQYTFGGLNLLNKIANLTGRLEGQANSDEIAILSFILLREE